MNSSWFETREDALLTMRGKHLAASERPHPEERRLRRVSKDEMNSSWFETREGASSP
jgi:hypothetical protein